MQMIENKELNSETIVLDEKHFVNCLIKESTLIYSGGDFGSTNTKFDRCRIQFSGSAGKTLAMLTMFGFKLPPGLVQPPSGPLAEGGKGPN